MSKHTKSIVRQIYEVDESGQEINTSDEVERHPAWSELVLDLVIVANFYQLGKGFTENTEKYGVLSLVLYYAQFAPQFDRWVDATLLLNKFETGNTYSMWSLFVFTLINRSIPLLNEGNLKPFAFCMILSIGGGIAFNCYVAWQVPCARVSTLTNNAVECVKLVGWIVIWLSSFHVAITVWVILLLAPYVRIYLYLYLEPIVAKYVYTSLSVMRIPLDVELMAERLGLLIVLAIGEVLMTTVKTVMQSPGDEAGDHTGFLPLEFTSWRPFFSSLLAVGLAGHTKLAYFDTYGCPGEKESGVKKHAFKVSYQASQCYFRFHMMAVMSIVLSAGMMEIGDEEYNGGGERTLSFKTRLISGLAFAGINGSFGIIREQHQYEKCLLDNETVSREVRAYVLAAVCLTQVLGAVFVPFSDPLMLQFMGQALFAMNILFEEFCRDKWLKDPLKGRPIHALFTDHHLQERTASTSAGEMTHITTFHSLTSTTTDTKSNTGSAGRALLVTSSSSSPSTTASSSKGSASERDPLLSIIL